MLKDPSIRSAFVRDLRRIAGEARNGEITARVKQLEEPMLLILNREFPLRTAMKMQRIEQRATTLASVTVENFELFRPELVRPRAEYPEAIHAHLQHDTSGHSLEFVNVMPVPVIVQTLVHPALAGRESVPLRLSPSNPLPITLPATPLGERPKPVTVRFETAIGSPESSVGEKLRTTGRYLIEGQSRVHSFEAKRYFPPMDRSPIDTSTLEATLSAHDFLVWDESLNRLRAEPGDWRVSGSLVLPSGVGLELKAGTRLRFEPGEALIATGPLVFKGRPDAPVVLEGRDATSLWSGIVALHSDEAHEWSNVIVRNTSGIARGGWILTGGVTLRDSRVRIEDSLFESNRCEDALNLVRSEFELINVRFLDTPSDAFDGDFVNGRIVGGSYQDIGGDGIDVSGATVSIEDVELRRIHDKALSIGERSQASISGVHIDDAGTAIASKDASRTEISNSEFSRIHFTAIMAYVKKPEFGPSVVIARDVILKEVGREALAQLGSQVTLNGVELEPEAIDIEELYERGHMRK